MISSQTLSTYIQHAKSILIVGKCCSHVGGELNACMNCEEEFRIVIHMKLTHALFQMHESERLSFMHVSCLSTMACFLMCFCLILFSRSKHHIRTLTPTVSSGRSTARSCTGPNWSNMVKIYTLVKITLF